MSFFGVTCASLLNKLYDVAIEASIEGSPVSILAVRNAALLLDCLSAQYEPIVSPDIEYVTVMHHFRFMFAPNSSNNRYIGVYINDVTISTAVFPKDIMKNPKAHGTTNGKYTLHHKEMTDLVGYLIIAEDIIKQLTGSPF